MQGCPPVLEGVNEWAGFWKASIEALRKGNGVSTSLTSRVFKEPAGFLFFYVQSDIVHLKYAMRP